MWLEHQKGGINIVPSYFDGSVILVWFGAHGHFCIIFLNFYGCGCWCFLSPLKKPLLGLGQFPWYSGKIGEDSEYQTHGHQVHQVHQYPEHPPPASSFGCSSIHGTCSRAVKFLSHPWCWSCHPQNSVVQTSICTDDINADLGMAGYSLVTSSRGYHISLGNRSWKAKKCSELIVGSSIGITDENLSVWQLAER